MCWLLKSKPWCYTVLPWVAISNEIQVYCTAQTSYLLFYIASQEYAHLNQPSRLSLHCNNTWCSFLFRLDQAFIFETIMMPQLSQQTDPTAWTHCTSWLQQQRASAALILEGVSISCHLDQTPGTCLRRKGAPVVLVLQVFPEGLPCPSASLWLQTSFDLCTTLLPFACPPEISTVLRQHCSVFYCWWKTSGRFLGCCSWWENEFVLCAAWLG